MGSSSITAQLGSLTSSSTITVIGGGEWVNHVIAARELTIRVIVVRLGVGLRRLQPLQ